MNPEPTSPPAPIRPISRVAWAVFAALLLLLAFRLSALESLGETLSQKQNRLAAPSDLTQLPDIGPAFIVFYATLSLLLAAIATFLAAAARAVSWKRLAEFLLIVLILMLALTSTFHAANRFSALVGTADLAASLAGGWTILLLCNDRLLGDRARRILAAAIIGLCTIAIAKSLMQYFIEFPDLAQFVKDHRQEVFHAQGIDNDPVQQDLFLHRIASNEVSGFALDSDVLASELIPAAALLTLLIAAAIRWFAFAKVSAPLQTARTRDTAHKKAGGATQIPPQAIALGLLSLLAIGALLVLRFTDSKGGIACALLAILAVAVGLTAKNWLTRHRRALIISAAALACLVPAAVILYGRAHDALPTKSLLFRWHYWTATVPIIKQSPALGVGLNNFGDYYTQFKRPSSPEDVKDPHNFFIRLAAETGLPAATLIAILVISFLACAMLSKASAPNEPPVPAYKNLLPILLTSVLLAAAWAALHILLAEPINTFTTLLTTFYALLAWTFFVAAHILLNLRHPVSDAPLVSARTLAAVLAVAAIAMLLYDQINIALVTGPVAMLFWILLASADIQPPARPSSSAAKHVFAGVAAALCLAASITMFIVVAIPCFSQSFPWDPAQYETRYVKAAAQQDTAAASRALDAAIDRSPRDIELLLQRIELNRRLGVPAAPEMRKILTLDQSNAGIRVKLALGDLGLPPAERLRALQEALKFDAALDPAEAKRLPPQTIAAIESNISELQRSSP